LRYLRWVSQGSKTVAVFQRTVSGAIRGHAYADEGSAAHDFGFARQRMRGEVLGRPGIGPPPAQVWLARVIRGKGDGLAAYTREDPTAGAGPYFLWAQWEIYTGVHYSMYEVQSASSMHETLEEAEAHWAQIASQPMERLFHLVLAAPTETTTVEPPRSPLPS